MTIQEAALRLLVAAALGSVIGIDRERLDRAAGLRTHALVSTASALIMIVSAFGFAEEPGRVVLDPSRVAAQVVSGIGFLGAGVIILRRNVVRGLTTAASIWAVAGIGLAAGGGLYGEAVVATAVLLVILVGLKPIEQRMFVSKRMVHVVVRADRHPGLVAEIEKQAAEAGLDVRQISIEPDLNGASTISLRVRGGDPRVLAAFAEGVRNLPGVRVVSYSPHGLLSEETVLSESDDEDD